MRLPACAQVRLSCGRASKWVLLAAVIANCFGLMVAYMVVFGDVLVGSAPAYNGVLHELLPQLDPATHW